MNPLVKAPLTVVALAAILYALLPPAPQDDKTPSPYAIDLTVPSSGPDMTHAPAPAPAAALAPESTTAEAETDKPETAITAGEAAQTELMNTEQASQPPVEPPGQEQATSETQSGDNLEPANMTAESGSATADAQSAEATEGSVMEAAPEELTDTTDAGETELSTAQDTEVVTAPEDIWIEHEIESGDTLASIFKDFGLSPALLDELVNCGPSAKTLANIRPGQSLAFRFDSDGQLMELRHQRSSISSLHINRNADGFESHLEEKPLETRTQTASGTINNSLFVDGQHAGLSDKVIMSLAELFNWDIDFARELHEGDHFSVIYEANFVDGEKYSDSDILAAEFVNNGKSYRAIRFEAPDGSIDYYAPDGTAKKKAFIKTPVKFSRISSVFTKKRWHPVLKRWRSHKGVDYAAPTGTPVKAAGQGKVNFIGRQRGYGKVIFLQHGDRYTTVYGHLSGFAKSLKKGDTVKQGDLIGYVGQTGLATGPHLHYEFRVNGKHVDPLSHDLPTAMPLPGKYMAAFKEHAGPLVEQLNLLATPRVANIQ